MAFAFIDGFDHYAALLKKWDEYWGCYQMGGWMNYLPSIGAWGRCGTPGVKFGVTESGILKSGCGDQSNWVVGLAIKPHLSWRQYLFVLKDGTTPQVYAFIDTNFMLKICTGSPGAETLVASYQLSANLENWRHFEIRIVLHATAGEIEAVVDGDTSNPVIDVTGVDTISTANAYANAVIIGSDKWSAAYGGQGNERYADDVVIRGDTSALSMWGDARVVLRLPTGAGAHTDFTPTSAPNWGCVDENPPNESDGVYSNTVNDVDTYAHAALPENTQTVLAVGVNHYTTKLEAGMRTIASALDIASSLNIGADKSPSLGSYKVFQEVFMGPYSKAEADASEFGVKITA